MDRGLFNESIEEQIELCRSVLVDKGEEYTPGSDRLSNFRQAAAAQNITMKQALAGMMAKHTISIYDMIWQEEDASMEKWEEKIGDHLNYLLILKAILVEELLSGAEDKAEASLMKAGAALATASGTLPKVNLSPGDYVEEPQEEFGFRPDRAPVPPSGDELEHARKMMPYFFGPMGGKLDEQHESD